MDENQYMPAIRKSWANRSAALGLKKGTKKRGNEACAFMSGVLIGLTSTGVMTQERAGMIGFLFMVGRGEEFLDKTEAA